jgi:hypothetical protein
MRIKLNKVIAGPTLCADAGESVTVDDTFGKALIVSGAAERVAAPKRETAVIDPARIEADERAEALRKAQEDAAKKAPDVIKKALDVLSLDEDDDWTSSGKPAMDRLKELTGSPTLTRAEVDAAFPEFRRPVSESNESGKINKSPAEPVRASGARSSAP